MSAELNGLKASIGILERYLALCLSMAAWNLGHYQLSGKAALFTSFDWFEEDHPAQVSQFVYKQNALLEVFLEPEPYSRTNVRVYVPLGRLRNAGENLYKNVRDESSYLPPDIWDTYILPELAFRRSFDSESYWPRSRQEGYYFTEGTVWRGSYLDEEDPI